MFKISNHRSSDLYLFHENRISGRKLFKTLHKTNLYPLYSIITLIFII